MFGLPGRRRAVLLVRAPRRRLGPLRRRGPAVRHHRGAAVPRRLAGRPAHVAARRVPRAAGACRLPPWQELSSRTHSVWRFRSAAPGADGDLPAWYECATNRGRACAYLPLLYVDYDLDLDRLNRAPAGRTYRFGVDVVGQPFGPRPRVRSVDVEVSYDDGATWRPAHVRRAGGQWQVTVHHPGSADHVSLRVDATAAGGASVTQEIIRAYRRR